MLNNISKSLNKNKVLTCCLWISFLGNLIGLLFFSISANAITSSPISGEVYSGEEKVLNLDIICLKLDLGVEDVCFVKYHANPPGPSIQLTSLPGFTQNLLQDFGSDWTNFTQFFTDPQVCNVVNFLSEWLKVSLQELASFGISGIDC